MIPRTIAVMQPYFFPYAGYFRLLAMSDVFVLFDDVQFPRRGRVHRCEIAAGRWLTLPLARQPREVLIRDLAFAPGARTLLDARLGAALIPRTSTDPVVAEIVDHLHGPLGTVVDFLETSLRLMAAALHLDVEIIRSSSLHTSPELRGESRIISLVKMLRGQRYVNAPGGRSLYDSGVFARAGIDLIFLPDYTGKFRFALPGLLHGGLSAMRAEMRGVALES